jgi:integrase
MTRTRDRASAEGLLHRMEARPRKDGSVAYRYHPVGKKPIALGDDKAAAIQKVLDLNKTVATNGNLNSLWAMYQVTPEFNALSENSKTDYRQSSKQLLERLGLVTAADITPVVCARYLRVERASSPVRANREMALLSNLMNLAVERGEIPANPCKQIRRNKERPRVDAPEVKTLIDFLAWARARKGAATVLSGMAEFAALTGNRRIEFLELHWPQVSADEVRLIRGKQRDKQVVEAIAISPALQELLDRMKLVSKNTTLGAVFPNLSGNPYTEQGFKSMWSKLVLKALEEKAIDKRFTFHDLRAYYVTQHKAQHKALPDLHSNPATTARVYDRTKVVNRNSL